MNAATTLHWLTNLRNLGSALGLERTQLLLERLNNPQNFCPYFHIAGTNGKGSTSVMIESIQRACQLLSHSPFSCRKVGDSPFVRELIISFGASGFVALFEIRDADQVIVGAVRHQRESDYH